MWGAERGAEGVLRGVLRGVAEGVLRLCGFGSNAKSDKRDLSAFRLPSGRPKQTKFEWSARQGNRSDSSLPGSHIPSES